MKDLVSNKIVIAERDNIAAVIEKGKVIDSNIGNPPNK